MDKLKKDDSFHEIITSLSIYEIGNRYLWDNPKIEDLNSTMAFCAANSFHYLFARPQDREWWEIPIVEIDEKVEFSMIPMVPPIHHNNELDFSPFTTWLESNILIKQMPEWLIEEVDQKQSEKG